MKTDVPPLPAGDPTTEEPKSAPGRKVTLIVMVLTGVVASLWVIGPMVFAGQDDPTAIDYKPVRRAVSDACTRLHADLAVIPAGMAAPDRAEAQNQAVGQLVARIRSLGPDALAKDEPIEQWLGDWEHIVATRRQALREGKRFVTPSAGGVPVNIRMFELIRSGLSKCDVPPVLLVPEPGRA